MSEWNYRITNRRNNEPSHDGLYEVTYNNGNIGLEYFHSNIMPDGYIRDNNQWGWACEHPPYGIRVSGCVVKWRNYELENSNA